MPLELATTCELFDKAMPLEPSIIIFGLVVPTELSIIILVLLLRLRLPVIQTLPFTVTVQVFDRVTLPVTLVLAGQTTFALPEQEAALPVMLLLAAVFWAALS